MARRAKFKVGDKANIVSLGELSVSLGHFGVTVESLPLLVELTYRYNDSAYTSWDIVPDDNPYSYAMLVRDDRGRQRSIELPETCLDFPWLKKEEILSEYAID